MTGLQLEIKELTPYKAGTPIQQEIGFDLAASTHCIMQLRRKLKENIVEIGIELIKVKKNLDHGDWDDWVQNDLGWHRSTAWRYMNAARMCNEDVALAQHINLEEVWGHNPKIPNRHSPEGEPRSIQDIERALATAAKQLRGDKDKILGTWRDVIFYAKKLGWCIDYFTKGDMEEAVYSLLQESADTLGAIEMINRDIQQKLEAVKMPKEIHLYGMGELEEKGIEGVKRESAVPLGG